MFIARVKTKSFIVVPTFSAKTKEQNFCKAFHFDVVDCNSESMRVVVFDSACTKFFKIIKIGDLLKLSNFVIRFADLEYNNLDMEYEIEINNSVVCPVIVDPSDDIEFAPLPESNFQAFSSIDANVIGEYLGNFYLYKS